MYKTKDSDTIFATCLQEAAKFKWATASQFSTVFAQKSDAVTSKTSEGIHCTLFQLHWTTFESYKEATIARDADRPWYKTEGINYIGHGLVFNLRKSDDAVARACLKNGVIKLLFCGYNHFPNWSTARYCNQP